MRIKHTIINISAGLGSQLLITALSFISRTVFIQQLGIEYLGISGLFTSILAMLSLAEAGIGSSIIYHLYKPVAEQDEPRMIALMRLYRHAYMVIALIVVILGLAILPFIDLFVRDTDVEHITLIYLLFLGNTVAPYLLIHKQSFLNVNQKNYIITVSYTAATILSTSLKIAILIYTQNFIYYLIVDSVITLTTSILLAWAVGRMYPFLKNKVTHKLDRATITGLVTNMKAIVLQNVGTYFIFGVDSILISSFISVAVVGLYANYKMLIDLCRTFVNQIFNNMYHSVGNLVAQESGEKVYSIYKVMMLLSFWFYSGLSILLIMIVQPFITIWIGQEYLMSYAVLIVLVVTFYERGMRNAISTVKTTAGIFHADRYVPLVQAAINLGISIALVHFAGIVGIFLGTWISALTLPFWTTPWLVYRRVFRKPLRFYYQLYGLYTLIGMGAFVATALVCSFLPAAGYFEILMRAAICIFIVNMLYIAVFHRTGEFAYLRGVVGRMAGKWLGTVKYRQYFR